jgi:hypothetical protein
MVGYLPEASATFCRKICDKMISDQANGVAATGIGIGTQMIGGLHQALDNFAQGLAG